MEAYFLTGMFGIGDNLHQRAVVRELMKFYEVWLSTCHVAVYHDLLERGLRLVFRHTWLHAQAKTIARERKTYPGAYVSPPPTAVCNAISYHRPQVEQFGSILGAMFGTARIPMPLEPDFSLPIPEEWRERARRLMKDWGHPVLIYRPVTLRPEWNGANRNPIPDQYAALFNSIRRRFFCVSVADLAPGREWIIGSQPDVDLRLNSGEMDFETMAAVFAEADLVFSTAGFAPVLAQAVCTPSVTIYGGRESFRTTQAAGAHLAPTLGIDADRPCNCFGVPCPRNCDVRITLAPAIERIWDFVDKYASLDLRHHVRGLQRSIETDKTLA